MSSGRGFASPRALAGLRRGRRILVATNAYVAPHLIGMEVVFRRLGLNGRLAG